jgi:exopolysaccharide production protein ExoQ
MRDANVKPNLFKVKNNLNIPWPTDQFIIGFVLIGVLLSTIQLATVGVAALVAFILLYTWVERKAIFSNKYAIPICGLLAYGLLSAIWSKFPHQTIYYGIQIALTGFAGIILASSPRPADTLFGMTTALIIHSTLSHFLGVYVPWEHGEVVFVGIAVSKNNYGSISSLTTISSLGLLYLSIQKNRKWVIAFSLIGVVAGSLGLVRSLATGNFVATMACCAFLIYINIYRVLPPRLRLASALYGIYAIVCTIIVFLFVKDQLVHFVLTALNKDVTLTGRTEIWDVAQEQIKQHFWLGTGQSAFWVEGNPPAESIWASHGIAGKRGFNFHNTYLEIMVHFGLIGSMIFAITLAYLIFKLFSYALKSPTIINGIWATFVIHLILLSPVESFNFTPINFYTVFLIAALARYPALADLDTSDPWQPITRWTSKLSKR